MNKQQEDFNRNDAYMRQNIKPLIDLYGGRCIIIHGGRVLDSDLNEAELAKRCELRRKLDFESSRGYSVFFIPSSLEEYSARQNLPPLTHEFETSVGGSE